jgi:hypothetical protein
MEGARENLLKIISSGIMGFQQYFGTLEHRLKLCQHYFYTMA